MKQDQPLTMGWCINCHRETNVKVEENGYYEKSTQNCLRNMASLS